MIGVIHFAGPADCSFTGRSERDSTQLDVEPTAAKGPSIDEGSVNLHSGRGLYSVNTSAIALNTMFLRPVSTEAVFPSYKYFEVISVKAIKDPVPPRAVFLPLLSGVLGSGLKSSSV